MAAVRTDSALAVDPPGYPRLPFAVGVFRGEWPLRRPFFAHRPSRDLV